VELFRLKVNYKLLYFLIIGEVVQSNGEDLINWDKCQEIVEVILQITGWQRLAYKFISK
jgi:hypothetical protein